MAYIFGTHDCYGCGVCAIACGKHIIKIQLNDDGFYEPVISEPDKCTNCGLCIDVCAYNHDDLSLKNSTITSYAAWSKNPNVRRKCSSGGVGFEVGKAVIAQGGKVCGVRFNAEKNQAEHYVAATDQDLIPSIGSKYIQSYTVDGFQDIITRVREAKRKGENPLYLLTGTPCQIDSFRRYLQRFRLEDNFILLDFFCHGVPSKLMWDKYVAYVEKQVGKITYVSWRNKYAGWHDSYALSIKGNGGCIDSRFSQGNLFYRFFLSDSCLGKACYDNCKYKYDHSSADIRIGDAWGNTFSGNEEGVSALLAFTKRGVHVIQRTSCILKEYPIDTITEGQMKICSKKNTSYKMVYERLHKSNITIGQLYRDYIKFKRMERWKMKLEYPFLIFIEKLKSLF